MNADDERAKEVTGRKKMTIVQLRFPQPSGRCWACLLGPASVAYRLNISPTYQEGSRCSAFPDLS